MSEKIEQEFDEIPEGTEVTGLDLTGDEPKIPVGADVNDNDVCLHEIKAEIVKSPMAPFAPDAMRLRIMGHKVGDGDHEATEMFTLITLVPNAAVVASRILEETIYSSPFTQAITHAALEHEEAEAAERTSDHAEKTAEKMIADADGDPMKALMNLFGSLGASPEDVKIISLDGDDAPRGFAPNSTPTDPVRIMKFDGSPSSTFAPIDNRDDYPDDFGGYL